ncbi:GspE/PulE family protein [Sporomusa malonica]|uniref:Type IV pilus assembly protein PilB n=1 Tax=Sporomusa malonica TaxID=112901 RepID=A0A1W2EC26_9FIRM|nr:GspE/PulE family protein [Sporomusa malonica]SMD06638.1 type IV pilus assembly protein PilB [Sporomusa malonica]
MLNKRKRLGDLLIESEIITKEQLDKALTVQKKTGERLGKVLINLGYVTESSMIQVLEFHLGVPHVDLSTMNITNEVAATISVSLAERYQVIPVYKDSSKLTLAMVDPTNFFAIDDVRMVSGCEVEPVIAAEREIMRAISQYYGVNELVEKAVNQLKPEELVTMSQLQTADDAPIIGIVNSLFSQAVRERASDIHLEPQDKTLRVRFRIDGVLREVARFTRDIQAAIVSRIKITGGMDISEKRLPQDGRIKITEAGREIDIRVSTLPTILGEKVVMRILDKQAVILEVGKLGFSADNLQCFRRLYTQSYGMILVTGPTGSGKTTTLYSTLGEINTIGKNTITVEDPVEYRLDGINQVQVNHKAGLTFALGLRSILRQDPNIVMVGEIRDTETADIAIRAALTGHMVLSTLHTNDAPGAITRLIDMGVEPFLAASSILGVLAQRLVRCICPECKTTYSPAADSLERLFLGVEPNQPLALSHGGGCAACGFTGYKGRMGIHEVMPVTSAIRELINQRASADEIAIEAKNQGMVSMRQDGIYKALAGLTTVEEVMRVAYTGL